MALTARIIPAIIPDSYEALERVVETMRFAPTVQIDIVDGIFAKPASWPFVPAGEPAAAAMLCERYEVQVDIMAVDPYAQAAAWVAAGAQELVIHLESIADLDPLKALRQQAGVRLWLAGADTLPVARYLAHQADIDGVQLMGIHTIGQQGQPPSPHVETNIRALRERAPNLRIQIDGSVNEQTLPLWRAAGATDFVVGSAITQATDPRAAYCALRALVTERL